MTPTDDEAALAVLAGRPPLCIRCGIQSVAPNRIICAPCYKEWRVRERCDTNFPSDFAFRAFVGLAHKEIPKWITRTWPSSIFGDKQP